MEKTYIDNSKFMEFISEMADKLVKQKFGSEATVAVSETEVKYSDDAQDFFEDTYEEIEYIANGIGLFSDNEKPTVKNKLFDRIDLGLCRELDKQKKEGKKFPSHDDIDKLIDSIIKDELNKNI
jgi:hypothetical protein